MRKGFLALAFLALSLLVACGKAAPTPTPTPVPTPTPTATPTPRPTPAAPIPGFHRDEKWGFSLSYPKDWMVMPSPAPETAFSVVGPTQLPGVNISPLPTQEGVAAARLAPLVKMGMGARMSNFQVVSQRETSLPDGTPAYELVFTGSPPDAPSGFVMKGKGLLVARGNRAFVLVGYSSQEMFASQEAQIDQVLQSFKLE